MVFVVLRIAGQNIDLEKVTETINVVPKQSYKKGDTHYDKYTIERTPIMKIVGSPKMK